MFGLVSVCALVVNKIEQKQDAHTHMHIDKHTHSDGVRPAGSDVSSMLKKWCV